MHGISPYSNWLPWDASAHGQVVDSLILWIHWFMLLLFVGWGAFFVMCLVKFRQRPGHQATYDLPKAKITKPIEISVIIVEAVLLIGFSIPAWAKYKNDPPEAGKRIEIRAVGEQFAWNFHYPGKDGKFGRTRPELVNPAEGNPLGVDDKDPAGRDDIVSPEMHVPFGKDVYIRVTSKDVIHSFFIPIMRIKQDAIPGMSIPVWFKAEKFNNSKMREALAAEHPLDEPLFVKKIANYVAMREYKDKSGGVILKVGDLLGDEAIKKLKAEGVSTIYAAPRAAAEVVCAQLCGGNHYQMKAPFFIDTEEEYNKWLASQSAPPAEQKKQPEGDFQS